MQQTLQRQACRRATGAGGQAQIQCASCHDPHIRDLDPSQVIKFLRLNRFQLAAPLGGNFDSATDMVCLACHDKTGWSDSAHASPTAADGVQSMKTRGPAPAEPSARISSIISKAPPPDGSAASRSAAAAGSMPDSATTRSTSFSSRHAAATASTMRPAS